MTSENLPKPKPYISGYLGFTCSWALAYLIAHMTSRWAIPDSLTNWILSLVSVKNTMGDMLQSVLLFLPGSIIVGIVQWGVLLIYLKDAHFQEAIARTGKKGLTPPLYFWIMATICGYLLDGVLSDPLYDQWIYYGRLEHFLDYSEYVYLSSFILAIIRVIPQYILLHKWFGRMAVLWLVAGSIAYLIGLQFYFSDLSETLAWPLEGLITGIGLLVIITRGFRKPRPELVITAGVYGE